MRTLWKHSFGKRKRKLHMPDWSTADLWDRYGDQLTCADPVFLHYGGKSAFRGEMKIIKLFEDNSLVRQLLQMPGHDRVLIVDGDGSTRCALVGDQLASLAIQNHWAGILVYGCIRDSQIISTMDIAIKALNTCPVKSHKKGGGEEVSQTRFAGITFRTGDFIYADADGILLSDEKLQ